MVKKNAKRPFLGGKHLKTMALTPEGSLQTYRKNSRLITVSASPPFEKTALRFF
jgi:hypothetical protein